MSALSDLFPERKPYRAGRMPVTDGHRLYYALYGNPRGAPVLFLHGGPGAGTPANAYRHFDPRRFNILTIDQRGSGRSIPFASIRANTTHHLVEDIRRFLRFLDLDSTYLFGGSWGSTLALCYSIAHPETVRGMILRGIWLCTDEENDYMLKGGWRTHFPEVWKRFVSHVPPRFRKDPAAYYWRRMNAKDPKTVRFYCREWALYEHCLCFLEYDLAKALRDTRKRWVVSLARFEAWYMRNRCFLPPDYILKNAGRIARIPTSIVHGRYDFVCTPETGHRLHRALPKSRLFFVTAGHSFADPAIRSTMMREIHRMAGRAGRS